MKAQQFLRDFVLTFLISFAATVVATFLWSLISNGRDAAEWGTAFRLGIVLGVVIPLTRALSRIEKTE